MAHVFISYAHGDNLELVADLKNRLRKEKFDVWNDEELLLAEEWSQEIEARIQNSFALIVIASKYSMSRPWVNFEWAYGLGSGAKVIVIQTDDVVLPERLERIQRSDGLYTLNGWKRLLSNLRRLRDETWMKYWIPIETPLIIQSALIGLMGIDDASELDNFVRILEKHGDESAVNILVNALDNRNEIVRAKAAWALGPMRQYQAVEPLINALDDNEAPIVIAHAAGALGHIGDSRAVKRLSEEMRNKSVFSSLSRQPYRQDTVANCALKALNLIGTTEALAEVEKWKQEQDTK
jgi:hypothetical protein